MHACGYRSSYQMISYHIMLYQTTSHHTSTQRDTHYGYAFPISRFPHAIYVLYAARLVCLPVYLPTCLPAYLPTCLPYLTLPYLPALPHLTSPACLTLPHRMPSQDLTLPHLTPSQSSQVKSTKPTQRQETQSQSHLSYHPTSYILHPTIHPPNHQTQANTPSYRIPSKLFV